jgi:hypothetical protein
MLKQVKAVTVAAGLAAGLAACGSDYYGADQVIAPPAYYQVVNGVPECYFVDSVAEVAALELAGLCPSYSDPTVMPGAWKATYYSYYTSSAYYGRYVPAYRRASYVRVTNATFGSAGVQRYTRVATVTVRHH